MEAPEETRYNQDFGVKLHFDFSFYTRPIYDHMQAPMNADSDEASKDFYNVDQVLVIEQDIEAYRVHFQ